MELFYMILGLATMYAFVHLALIQKKAYSDRTQYEKVVTWFSLITIGLLFISYF